VPTPGHRFMVPKASHFAWNHSAASVASCFARHGGRGSATERPLERQPAPAFTLLDVIRERRYAAEIEWRRGKSIGVSFCDLTDPEDNERRAWPERADCRTAQQAYPQRVSCGSEIFEAVRGRHRRHWRL